MYNPPKQLLPVAGRTLTLGALLILLLAGCDPSVEAPPSLNGEWFRGMIGHEQEDEYGIVYIELTLQELDGQVTGSGVLRKDSRSRRIHVPVNVQGRFTPPAFS